MTIPSPGWTFLILSVLVVVGALLSSLTLALHTLSRARLASIIEKDEQSARSRRLRAIEDDADGHAAAIAIVRIAINLVTALACVAWVSGLRDEPYISASSLVFGLALATIVNWIVALLIPLGISNHVGEHAVAMFSVPIRAIHAVCMPLLLLQRFIDEVVRRLAGTSNATPQDEINAELMSVVSEGEREGHLDETEREMLEAVVEFRTTLAESIMTPRTEVDALAYTDDLLEVQRFINEHGHSRVPVYEENLDHIVGILYAKDLLRWLALHDPKSKPFNLRAILREPTFVPETKTIRELLTQLLAAKVHIAIIIDEYGGTSGLVTMEDIVEEIFGEIQDEYENPEDEPGGVELDVHRTSAEIDARTEIDDANDELEQLGLEFPESDDYDTVAGYINTTLGRIPDQGESFSSHGMTIEVLEAEPTRVVRLRVTPAPVVSESE